MSLALRSLQPHLNSYHRDVSLLFQFILSQFLAIHKEAKPLKALARPPRTRSQCETLLAPISKLSGVTQDYMRFFVWNLDSGLVSKLKNYCSLLSQQSLKDEKRSKSTHQKRISLLQQNSNQAWLICMQCIDILRALKEEGPNPKVGEALCKTIQKLMMCLSRIGKTLIPLIETFKDDENVLFFIVRHSHELDDLFGDKFVTHLFTKMHREGSAGIEKLLIKHYSKRGFDNLLPVIKAKMARVY